MVLPVLLYGIEARTISDTREIRLTTFEMWLYRRKWNELGNQYIHTSDRVKWVIGSPIFLKDDAGYEEERKKSANLYEVKN